MRAGRPKVVQCAHGGADAAPGVEHVVHQDDPPPVYVHRYLRALHGRPDAAGHVVPVESDVQLSHGDGLPLEPLDGASQPPGQGDAPRVHAHQHQVGGAPVPLQYLVGHAAQGALHLVLGEDAGRHRVAGLGLGAFRLGHGHSAFSPSAPTHKKPLALLRQEVVGDCGSGGSRPAPTSYRPLPCQPHGTGLKGRVGGCRQPPAVVVLLRAYCKGCEEPAARWGERDPELRLRWSYPDQVLPASGDRHSWWRCLAGMSGA